MVSEPTLGDWLREKRIAAGLTQGDVATTLGYSRTGITMIETDRQGVTVERFEDLCSVLSVHPSQWYNRMPADFTDLENQVDELLSVIERAREVLR